MKIKWRNTALIILHIVATPVSVLVLISIMANLTRWANEPLHQHFNAIEAVARVGVVQLFQTFVIAFAFSFRHLKCLFKLVSLKQIHVSLVRLIIALLLVLSIQIDPLFWNNLLLSRWIPLRVGHFSPSNVIMIVYFAFWHNLFYAFKVKPAPKTENNETPPNES